MSHYYVSGFFESLLQATNADLVTEIFFIFSMGLFVASSVAALKSKYSTFVTHAPNLLTSLGILGTFVGIVIGLLGFDANNIDSSVPLLLAGLKTAFNTSLMGMLLAICFKTLDNLWFAPKRAATGDRDDASAKDIYAAMIRNNHLIQELVENQMANSDRLWVELEQFASMMSKSATEQVVEALNNMISDFNNNLMEQFGSNFKALDASVIKLVDWQEQHAEGLEVMVQQYEAGVQAISNTSEALSSISEKCDRIPQTMGDLQETLDANQHQIQELNRHLEAFVDMRNAAIEAVPQLQSNLSLVSEQLMSGATEVREVMAEGATQFSDSVANVHASMLNTGNHIQTQSSDIAQLLQDTANEMNNSLRDILSTMSNEMTSMKEALTASNESFSKGVSDVATQMGQELELTIRKTVAETGAAVDKEVKMLDESMQNEIDKAMKQLGEDLLSITRMFLQDYKELTDNMKKVVNIQLA